MKTKLISLLLLCGVLSISLACGGGGSSDEGAGGSGGSSDPMGSVGLLIGDAPSDELSSFSLTVSELRLRHSTAGLTDNLLSGPRTIDVLGLGLADREALLQITNLPPGRFDGVFLKLNPTSLHARNALGIPIILTVGSTEAEATFRSTNSPFLQLSDAEFASVSVDVVLDQSLTPVVPGSGFLFNLVLKSAHAEATPKLDDFTGRVTSVDKAGKFFNVEIVDAIYEQSTFGIVKVEVDDEDLLFQFTGAEFGNSNAFLANLQMDDLIEIEGSLLRNGAFDAERCEIEDRHTNQVRLEGRVMSVDIPNQTLELLWEEIEMGYAHARPVLVALGDPGVLPIAWDNQTKFMGTKGASNLGPDDLVEGQKLEVRFSVEDFEAPLPFYASKIRVDGEERYEGIVDDVEDLPGAFTLMINDDHPAAQSGRITDPVEVSFLHDTVVFLDTGVSPWLQRENLLPDMSLKLTGKLTGSGAAAALLAERVEVEPGRLEGLLSSLDPALRKMTVIVYKVTDPFGGPEPMSSSQVWVDAQAVITLDGEAITFTDLRNAFADLGVHESLELELEGIGDGDGDLRAFQLSLESDS